MKDFISWVAKNIMLPLLPALIGSLIRIISSGEVNRDTFDTGELAFSMAMLNIIVMISASRLTDRSLRDSLLTIFTIETAVFLVLFACASLLKVQVESAISEDITQIRSLLNGDTIPTSTVLGLLNDKHFNNYLVMLSRIRFFVVIVSVVMVPLTILFKVKYKLED